MPNEHPTETVAPRKPVGKDALVEALDTSFRLLRWAMALVAVLYLLSGLFIVRQHERALVLVFGRITGRDEARVRGPGLHWTFPTPFAEYVRIETERVREIEIGTLPPFTPGADRPEIEPDPDWENLFLTGDANLLNARWSLRYTIHDPETYLFHHGDPEDILTAELQNAVIHTFGRFAAESALRTDVETFRASVNDRLQDRIRARDLGVRTERVELTGVQPPAPIAHAFEAVVQAEQDRSRQVSEARAYATRRTQEAWGEAARTLAEATADRERWVSSARADAEYFRAIREKEQEAPGGVLRHTLLQDSLQRTFARVGQTWFIRPHPEGKQELRILMSPERRALMLPGEGFDDAD